MPTSRAIVHLDADAFFAAVEQASDSKLRGKPVAVGGEKRGIIASASYEARRYGVFTPMPTSRARKLCPNLIVLPGNFERYEQFSNWMFGYCYDFTPDVEQTSIDEGYFDLSGTRKPPSEIALTIRKAIGQRLKITVSEGIGTNKLVSAVASKLTKPAAFHEVPPGKEAAYLFPLANKWLPGIGPKTSVRLNSAGLALIQHVALTPLSMLELVLGKQATAIQKFANGVDDRPLIPALEPQKTFSHQETFSEDLTDEEYIEAVLRRMADNLFATVREEGKSVRTLTVRVRYNDFDEDQASESLREPTDLETDVYSELRVLLRKAWKRRVSVRLVSLKLSNIYSGPLLTELPLGGPGHTHEANARLAFQVDALRRTHGQSIILRGHDFRLRSPPLNPMSGRTPKRGVALILRPKTEVLRSYIPLRTHSHYSFLDSTLSPARLVKLAASHKLKAVALTDTGNLHGAVEFSLAATEAGIKPIFGTEIKFNGAPLLLYVESSRGYENLCRLLSKHAMRTAAVAEESAVAAQERKPFVREEFEGLTEGLLAVSSDTSLSPLFPKAFYRMATTHKGERDFPSVACPPAHYESPGERQRYDILQSIRTLTLLRERHAEKDPGRRLHFRTPAEMGAACDPEWLKATFEIAERCNFALPLGKPQFPAFKPPDGSQRKSSSCVSSLMDSTNATASGRINFRRRCWKN